MTRHAHSEVKVLAYSSSGVSNERSRRPQQEYAYAILDVLEKTDLVMAENVVFL